MTGKFKDQHQRYKGVVCDSKGYLMVLKPEWFTGRKGSRYVFLHNVVVCEHLGITEIPTKWCVHHCDENPHNNDFDNLVLMSMSDHMRLHHLLVVQRLSRKRVHSSGWKRTVHRLRCKDIVYSAWGHAAVFIRERARINEPSRIQGMPRTYHDTIQQHSQQLVKLVRT